MPAASEALYVTSLEEIAWGLFLLAITLFFHGIATTLAILATSPRAPDKPTPALVELGRVTLLAELLVIAHLVEVMLWAAFFYWKGSFPNPSVSYYFAVMEYTTVGSDYDLPPGWQLLGGLIAICGLLTFAWSTGVLMTAVQAAQDRRVAQRLAGRAAKRGAKKDGAGGETH